MSKTRIPDSLHGFIERQQTMPVADIWNVDRALQRAPYGGSWSRAVDRILLSGRVQATFDGTPNRTDVNRVGKEANFNQHLIARIGTFLVALGAPQCDRQNRYEAGLNLAAFWNREDAKLATITRQAVLRLVGHETGHHLTLPKPPADRFLIEFLSLFFRCFQGLALVESEVDQVVHDFSQLPPPAT